MGKQEVLLIEDSATDALIVKHALRRSYAVTHVRTAEEAMQRLLSGTPALVLSDYFLPGGTVVDIQQWIAEHGLDVPVIVMSGQGDEKIAAETFKLGAYEYVVKSEETLSSISLAVDAALKRNELERRAQILQQIVEHASDVIVTMSLEGAVLTANRAAEHMLGYVPKEIVGEPSTTLFPDCNIMEEIAPLLEPGASKPSWQMELNARHKNGTLIPVHLSASVLRDRSGKALYLIGIVRDVTERRELVEKLKRLSVTDNLTGLANHRFFHERLHYEFVRARRYDEPLSGIMIDVDYFKAVNDTYGHLTGDRVLRSLAEIIKAATRSSDLVARYGGEEFWVLLPNTPLAGAMQCAENVRRRVEAARITAGIHQGLQVTISAGVTALLPDVADEEDLLRRVDAALLDAKRGGRNAVRVWQKRDKSAAERPVRVHGKDVTTVCKDVRRLIRPALAHYVEATLPLIESLYRHSPEIRKHGKRVSALAKELGSLTGLRGNDLKVLERAAYFHDVGRLLVPIENRDTERAHTLAGDRLLAELKVFGVERLYVRHHCERYDGTGFPGKLAGKAIPLGARIIAVADAFDKLMHPREAGPQPTEAEALASLNQEAGTRLDPNLLSLLTRARQACARL